MQRHAPKPPAIATYKTRFTRRRPAPDPRLTPVAALRIPPVTRMLVLAYRIDGMIRSGEVRDWAAAARLLGITRARMTQVGNTLLLAPDIQEAIFTFPSIIERRDLLTERELRPIVRQHEWIKQRQHWTSLPHRPRALR